MAPWAGRGPRPRAAGVSAVQRVAVLSVLALGSFRAGLRCWLPTARGAAPPSGPTLRSPRGQAAAARRLRTACRALGEGGPGQFSSVPAQKVSYLLGENPGLFEDALEREFLALEEKRELAEKEARKPDADGSADSSMEQSLFQRFGEVQALERLRSAAELLRLAVAGRLELAGALPLQPLQQGSTLQLQSAQSIQTLKQGVHSPEALEAVEAHMRESLAPIVGAGMNSNQVMHMPLVNLGQAYAMSVIYGYVLRRAEQRVKLERMMSGAQVPPPGSDTLQKYITSVGTGSFQDTMNTLEVQMAVEGHVNAYFGDLRQLMTQYQESLMRVASRGGRTQDALREVVESGEVVSVKARSSDVEHLLLHATAFGAMMHAAESDAQKFLQLTPSSESRLGNFGVTQPDS